MAGTTTRPETTCLTRTCLKWTPDGELSAEDRALVLERLQHEDGDKVASSRRPSER